ncbi:hypothetical protein J2TS6_42680 [Paenibacillus albilobatus]|uniref:Phage tail tape measure protein domain-containing protein n=1 Tax=Paenibacillus albilobatus TaxID=2716884 RepID=A0A919XLZ6_9BACL|nr:phage tail tape measure protein [Paenibacillus albilobatus]GIO33127.1 hypothetical protein J2TS6_42680 [Paenibacillus albilobatus]
MSREYEIAFQLAAHLQADFRRSFDQANAQIARLENELRQVQRQGGPERARRDAIGASEAFGGLSEKVRGFGETLQRVAEYTGAKALIDGVVGSFQDVIGSVGEFQGSMKQFQAATGMTKQEMAEISKSAKNLYNQNLGESWEDLTDAMTIAKQVTKQQGKELENTTKNAIVYRDVFKGDFAESLKTADTMAKNFGITNDEAFNLLAQGAQKGLDKSGELLDSANEYSVYFKTLGFEANQMFDIFGAGLEKGAFNLDKVGDAMKEFGIRSKDGSKNSAEGFQAMGLNAKKMTAEFAAGGPRAQKAFYQVMDALEKMKDPAKKNIATINLFGTQAEDMEKDVIAALGHARKQFDMTKNTMEEVASIKYDTVGMAFRGIGRQMMTTFIMPLGDLALPLLQKFGGWFNKAIPSIQKFFKQVGGWIGGVAKQVKSMIGPEVGQAMSSVKKSLSSLFSGDIGGAAFNYAKMFGLSDADASGIANTVKGAFSQISELQTQWANSLKKIWPTVKSVFGSISGVIKQLAPVMMKVGAASWTAFAKISKALVPIGIYISQKFWPIVSKVFGFLANEVAPAVSRGISAMLPTIMSVVGKVGQTISAMFNLVKPIIDGLVAAFNFAFPYIKTIVINVINTISGILKGLMTALGGVLDFITGVFTGNWSQAWDGVVEVFGGIWSGLKALVAVPINAVIRLVNKAIASINNINVEIPEWLGGGTLGFNVPQIPEIDAYAKGGIANRPSIFGEAGPEIAIPLNNKPRSRGLLDTANRLMGRTQNTSTVGDFVYNPQFVIQGNADRSAIEEMDSRNQMEFKKQFNEYKRQQRRVSLSQ